MEGLKTQLIFYKIVVFEKVVDRLVVIAERLEHLGFLEVKPERRHGHFEPVVVHGAVRVRVERRTARTPLLV